MFCAGQATESPDHNPQDPEQLPPTGMSWNPKSCVHVQVLASGFTKVTQAWKITWWQPSSPGCHYGRVNSSPWFETAIALLWGCVLLSKHKKTWGNRKMQLLAQGSKEKLSPVSTKSCTDTFIRIQTEKNTTHSKCYYFLLSLLSAYTTTRCSVLVFALKTGCDKAQPGCN